MNVDQLEALAKVATSGEWERTHSGDPIECWQVEAPDGLLVADCRQPCPPNRRGFRDAAFIAAANPSTVLRLIAVIRAARDVVDAWGIGGTGEATVAHTAEFILDMRAALDVLEAE